MITYIRFQNGTTTKRYLYPDDCLSPYSVQFSFTSPRTIILFSPYLKDNKKETNAWFQACGINVPLGGTQLGVIRSIDFNGSIAQNAENVNSENENVRWSLNNLSKDAAIHYDDKNRASDVSLLLLQVV